MIKKRILLTIIGLIITITLLTISNNINNKATAIQSFTFIPNSFSSIIHPLTENSILTVFLQQSATTKVHINIKNANGIINSRTIDLLQREYNPVIIQGCNENNQKVFFIATNKKILKVAVTTTNTLTQPQIFRNLTENYVYKNIGIVGNCESNNKLLSIRQTETGIELWDESESAFIELLTTVPDTQFFVANKNNEEERFFVIGWNNNFKTYQLTQEGQIVSVPNSQGTLPNPINEIISLNFDGISLSENIGVFHTSISITQTNNLSIVGETGEIIFSQIVNNVELNYASCKQSIAWPNSYPGPGEEIGLNIYQPNIQEQTFIEGDVYNLQALYSSNIKSLREIESCIYFVKGVLNGQEGIAIIKVIDPPTPTPTATPTNTATATSTSTPTATATPTLTNTPPPGATLTFTPTPSNTPTLTNTPPPGASLTPTPRPSNTPTSTPTPIVRNYYFPFINN